MARPNTCRLNATSTLTPRVRGSVRATLFKVGRWLEAEHPRPRRFDPQRALATPRSVAALLGPDPRVIADEIWAKLMWAGLNLQEGDLPQTQAGNFYPLELVRAVTLTWLFSGQRSDEIARLHVGCIRWQHDGTEITGDSKQVLARDAVCLLEEGEGPLFPVFPMPWIDDPCSMLVPFSRRTSVAGQGLRDGRPRRRC